MGSLKNLTFKGGGGRVMENQYREGIAYKGGLGQFADLRWGAWQERARGGGGVDTPMHTL